MLGVSMVLHLKETEIWEPALFKAIAEKSNQETTFSTFTSARKVRDGLASAGFKVEKVQDLPKSVNVSRANSWVTEQLTPGPPPARSTQKIRLLLSELGSPAPGLHMLLRDAESQS